MPSATGVEHDVCSLGIFSIFTRQTRQDASMPRPGCGRGGGRCRGWRGRRRGRGEDDKVVDAEFEDVTDKNKKTGSGG